MPYIEIAVELDEFDLEDLIEEVCSRISTKRNTSKIAVVYRAKLKEAAKLLLEEINPNSSNLIEINSIDNQAKYDHIYSVFEKYSVSDFERLLP